MAAVFLSGREGGSAYRLVGGSPRNCIRVGLDII